MTELSVRSVDLLREDAPSAKRDGGILSFSTEKKAFLRALSRVQSVVEKRNTIPILSNVKIEATEDGLLLTATDMDLAVAERFDARIEEYGAASVSAHMLYDVIRKLPEDAPVSCSAGNGTFAIESGNCSFSLAALPAEQFPVMERGETARSFALTPSELTQLIDKTRFAISTEETRYYLNGLYLHYAERDGVGALVAVSTDGHRLAKAELPSPEGTHGIPAVIIPRKTVAEIRKIAEEQQNAVEISLSDGKIVFSYDSGYLISKLIDGNFPDYQAAIPKSGGSGMQVYTEALSRAIDRVSTVSSDKTRSVRVDVAPGTMKVSARSDNNSVAQESLEIDYDGAPAAITFNSRYLLDTLSVIESDVALFAFSEPGAPVVIRDPVTEGALYVIMPMRV
jgi:DNA polymerase-3 subunit beta